MLYDVLAALQLMAERSNREGLGCALNNARMEEGGWGPNNPQGAVMK